MNLEELKAQNPYPLRLSSYGIPIGLEAIQHNTWNEAIDFAYKMGWRFVSSEEESRKWWFAKGIEIFDDTQSVWDTLMEYRQWLLEGSK